MCDGMMLLLFASRGDYLACQPVVSDDSTSYDFVLLSYITCIFSQSYCSSTDI